MVHDDGLQDGVIQPVDADDFLVVPRAAPVPRTVLDQNVIARLPGALVERALDAQQVVRMDAIEGAGPDQLVAGVARDAPDRFGEEQDGPITIQQRDGISAILDKGAVIGFALLFRTLCGQGVPNQL